MTETDAGKLKLTKKVGFVLYGHDPREDRRTSAAQPRRRANAAAAHEVLERTEQKQQ
jgi:hypothetical protein